MSNTIETIQRQIQDNPVLLYMKGTPKAPQCGFSARVSQILNSLNVNYSYVNILTHPDIRATLPTYINWPTFPQLYIQGELIGGCDIVSELYTNNELEPILTEANAIAKEQGTVTEVVTD